MNDAYYFIISYALIIFIGFFLINFLSNGFFGTFLRVKASRGKKVLVEVHAVTDVYYVAGKFDGSILKYKTRGGKEKSLTVEQTQVIRKIGVFCVITNEVNDNVLDVNFNAGQGGNTEDYDHLLKRVMMAPQIDDNLKKVTIGILILVLVILVINTVLTYNMSNQVLAMSQNTRVI